MAGVEFNTTVLLVTMIVYLAIMVSILVYFARQEQDTVEVYSLGGRGLGWLPSAMSSMASQSSGFIFIGLVGVGYTLGGFSTWYILGDALNAILLWTFFAWRLKKFSDHNKSIDLPDLLADIYNDKGNWVRSITAIAMAIFMIGYVSSQCTSAAKTLGPLFNLDMNWGIVIAAALVLLYTVFAGYKGVVWTDTVQGFLMMLIAFVTPVVALKAVGGWGALQAGLAGIDPMFLTARQAGPIAVSLAVAIGWFSVSFSTWGQGHVVTRIMGMDSLKGIKKAALLSTFFCAFTRMTCVLTGMCARVLFPNLSDPEASFPLILGTYFHPVIAGIAVMGVLAAVITTADSQLLAAGTTIVRNIYQKMINKNASEENLVKLTKWLMVIITIVCITFAIYAKGVVFYMVLFAYVGGGAALGIPLFMGLFWKRANKYGAMAGCIVGLLTVCIWKLTGMSSVIHEGVPGLILAALAVVIGSLLTKEDPYRIEQHNKIYGEKQVKDVN
ncbi:MAG: sodium/proline symporter [Syntrophomonadaceae bacterium]|jgi:sodium/proline symporter